MIPINLEGKTALITGGTRGIGQAISLILAKAGANTIAIYHSDEASAQASLAERQATNAGTHQNYQADVSNAAQVDQLCDNVRTQFGSLNFLVLNAGIGSRGKITDITPEQWQQVLDTNLTSAYLLTRAVLPMINRAGSIVAISSGGIGQPGSALYGASKAGLLAFVQSLAQDVGADGIRVNAVQPGSTNTAFGGRLKPEEVKQAISSRTALRRIGEPDDIAKVVLFLCSDLAQFVTGQAIRADGGYLAA